MVQGLLAAGADVTACDKVGDTALHHLASYSAQKPGAVGAARLLLQREWRCQRHQPLCQAHDGGL